MARITRRIDADGADPRAAPGGSESFARIFEDHRAALVRHCAAVLHDPHAAEDVVQETFMRASARLDLFDPTRPAFPWLRTIAHRLALNTLRGTTVTPMGGNGAWLEALTRHRGNAEEDVPFEMAHVREQYAAAVRALAALPPRQRRALLRSLAGTPYSEIAAEEKISLGGAKLLVFRAREQLRNACRSRMLGGVMLQSAGLRRRVREISFRLRTRGGTTANSFLGALGALGGSLAPGVTAMALAIGALAPPAAMAGYREKVLAPIASISGRVSTFERAKIQPAPAPVRTFPVQHWGVPALLDPTRDATPDNTEIFSITPSPGYEKDHTLFAAGDFGCLRTTWCEVLFISRDGGATWIRPLAKRFCGTTILLPPAYPADPRIFAMGLCGLQVSSNGGASFDVALPLYGPVAISPLFNAGDPRILIGGSVITEYWADHGIAKPARLIGPTDVAQVAFSPAYAADRTIFVGGARPDSYGGMRPTVNRCVDLVCDSVVFDEGVESAWIRPSPAFARDKTVFAFDRKDKLFRSVDGGKTFAVSTPSFARRGVWRDLLVAADGTLLAAFLNGFGTPNGVYRSRDGGATWTGISVPLPGFGDGVSELALLPDGRLIAAGINAIACSTDSGRSWKSRCPSSVKRHAAAT
jgi:RNA polymerase sigma factor (sigma-70 family)